MSVQTIDNVLDDSSKNSLEMPLSYINLFYEIINIIFQVTAGLVGFKYNSSMHSKISVNLHGYMLILGSGVTAS